MGNQSFKAYCPTHKQQKIKYLCSQKRCIEPLCQQCIRNHRAEHQKLGFSPKIVSIQEVISQHKDFLKINKRNLKKEDKISVKDGQFIPVGYLLKKLTKQYFTKRLKNSQYHSNYIGNQTQKRHNFDLNKNKNKKEPNEKASSSSSSSSCSQDGVEYKRQTKMAQIIYEYQIYKKMQNNNQIKSKVIDFLKKNLILNQGVVGKQFSHLYQ